MDSGSEDMEGHGGWSRKRGWGGKRRAKRKEDEGLQYVGVPNFHTVVAAMKARPILIIFNLFVQLLRLWKLAVLRRLPDVLGIHRLLGGGC